MKKAVAIVFVAAALLAPGAAGAGERVFDGALGAASGALVGGPVGFVAGGVIGFVAGPHIAHGLGFRHHYYGRRYRHAASNGGDERTAEARPDGR